MKTKYKAQQQQQTKPNQTKLNETKTETDWLNGKEHEDKEAKNI